MRVKICGLRTTDHVAVASDAGAAYIGLVFFPKSPRHVTLSEARQLALSAPVGLAKVALVVNPTDAALEAMLAEVPIDILQLQGAETPERVAEIRDRTGLPVMKAVGIADAEDLEAINRYASVADQLLIDAKPPRNATLPGGNGLAFDWRLLQGRRWPVPWMLAGGLTSDNVADAIALTGAQQVDVSSGVEHTPGMKDPERIRAFISAAMATD
ncbi:MAG: phosphoribosylanthranilate isomerase [Pseudomonadota bacterium]